MDKYFKDSYIDEQGAEYSADGKILIQCPEDFEGDFVVPEGVEILAHISGLTPSLKLGRPSALFAFFNCSKLRSVKIPSTVKEIDSWNFALCPNLKTIEVSPDNPIYDSRQDCHAIIETATNKLIAGGYKSTIPEGIVEIDDLAFWGCVKLSHIVFPKSLRAIGWKGLYHCDALTEIYIPANLTKLGGENFHRCPNITEIIVDKNNPVYDSRNNCNAVINTERNCLVLGCVNTKIPKGITEIGDEAFSMCKELESIEIPESVTHIGDVAFFGCKSLRRINIPSNCTIGRNAFMECPSLNNDSDYTTKPPQTKEFPRFIKQEYRIDDVYRLLQECSSARRWNDALIDLKKQGIVAFSKSENYQSIYNEIKRSFPNIKFGCKTFQNECNFSI
ncbi:MAG: leucine-rich repeat domain-containing protein [Paludibacteraceae bacterium]|nr:leucine-rich repeat domain-containing protein [Paludibacteraceae bacterium]